MNQNCMTKNCRRTAANGQVYRGLCLPCYSTAKRAVEFCTTTWDKLEELGLVLPVNNPFTTALNEATKEKNADDE